MMLSALLHGGCVFVCTDVIVSYFTYRLFYCILLSVPSSGAPYCRPPPVSPHHHHLLTSSPAPVCLRPPPLYPLVLQRTVKVYKSCPWGADVWRSWFPEL